MKAIYRVVIDGRIHEGIFAHPIQETSEDGLTQRRFEVSLGDARLTLTVRSDGGGEILEPVLTAPRQNGCVVRDYMVGFGGETICRLHYCTSDWGSEFSPAQEAFLQVDEKVLQVTAGRSSKQLDPWAGIDLIDGAVSLAVGFGGNWRMEVSKANGTVLAGLHGEIFEKTLSPGEPLPGLRVALAKGQTMEDACRSLRGFLYRHVVMAGRLNLREAPVVYNPWWPYEDRYINEDVCRRNAEAAKAVGATQFMLDAGWFGGEQDTGAQMDWFEKRGDWENVNRQRFPHGMAALGRDINARGLKFGMWCEIEAIGAQAQVRVRHPQYAAERDGHFLGYACMASPETRAWAKAVLVRLIEEYGARWIKFDFNLDPGLGCDRAEHGHGRLDGLYEHYRGYYQLLDEIHRAYPDVVLENCSSGGLRLDFETMSHTCFTHLSDPDYVEHHFQVFWGAVNYLPAASCYHFTQSQMRNPMDNDREFEPIQPDMPRHRFDTMIRAGMVCNLGLSYRLDEFPEWCLERLKRHIALYRETAIPFIYNGTLYRLTGQVIRGGGGDRWQGYQYNAENGDSLLLVFRLRGAPQTRTLRLEGLLPDGRYALCFEDAQERGGEQMGRSLMEQGICLDWLPEEGSEIIRFTLK